MTVDFAITCSLVRPGRPRYPVFVHRAAALLHAFFRPHLAMTPLRFASPSPSSGWTEDFHLQAVVHTRHTRKTPRLAPRGFLLVLPPRSVREDREQQQRHDIVDLDHRVDGGAARILIGITAGIARYRPRLGRPALSALLAVLDVHLCLVPAGP